MKEVSRLVRRGDMKLIARIQELEAQLAQRTRDLEEATTQIRQLQKTVDACAIDLLQAEQRYPALLERVKELQRHAMLPWLKEALQRAITEE